MKVLIGADQQGAVIPSLGLLKIGDHLIDQRKERQNLKVIQQYLAQLSSYSW
jgi:hypothetical protein